MHRRPPTSGPAAGPDIRASAADGNDRLAAARPAEFTGLFDEAVTGDFGAAAHLHQILETASGWCRTHDARSSASELDTIASRLVDLGEEVHLVAENIDHEIRHWSDRATAAVRPSPAAAARGASPSARHAPAPLPPSAAHALPRSR
ncbi:hypothetical protein [Streptomyces niveiscabiei]|uniref:Uncharacterized protein n=1 Tax=Streptomyces niveiscabiei TaxID=164115 RepID=A0ABW9I2F5_9ACTN